MSKTSDVIQALKDGKSVDEIKAEIKCSDSLISRCKTRLEASQKQEEPEEEEVTDDEIDSVIKEIKITPEKKHLTSSTEGKKEHYRCTACNHEWDAEKMPTSCPNCKGEF